MTHLDASKLPKPGDAIAVSVGRYDVALFNIDGDYYAYENACPHQGGPIAEGYIDGATVTCPWHAWCFDLRTGTLTIGDFARLRRFPVSLENGSVAIGPSPEPES